MPAPAADALAAPDIATALKGFQGSAIKQHMSVLADDALEGRGLGSAGYEGALQYVEKAVTSFGLRSAMVPLRHRKSSNTAGSAALRAVAIA